MNKIRKQSGFTLIELMIVIAILAILMAIAIPAYQDYTIRSQVSEGMNLAGGARTAVAEFWTNSGDFPTNNTEAGIASPATAISGEYVLSVQVGAGGAIRATFRDAAPTNQAIRNETLVLTPSATATDGSIIWDCDATGDTSIDAKYLPARCRQ